jgi:glutathione S-transferase
MLTVHHLGNSQSERVVWLCEELAVPYELVRYEREPATQLAPPDYKALQPFGTAPAITDGDLSLGETGAIFDYLIARYGQGRLTVASDDPAFADYLYWLHFANGSFMPSAMLDYVLRMVGAENTPAGRTLRKRGVLAMQISNARLGQAPYFAGEAFTAADVMMVLPLRGGGELSRWPHVAAYLERIGQRPAYQRAMRKAEPDRAPGPS